MSPTQAVRKATYLRDDSRCCSCGALAPLSWQHRQAVGMGGRNVSPDVTDGVTACLVCNELFEASLQDKALRFGWKVRKWVTDVAAVPVFYAWSGIWCLLLPDGSRRRISRADAEDRMVAVYGDEWARWSSFGTGRGAPW